MKSNVGKIKEELKREKILKVLVSAALAVFSTSLPVEASAIDLGDNYSISADSDHAMYCAYKMTAGDHLTVTLKGASGQGVSSAIFVYKEMADLTVGNHAVVTTDMTSEGMVINDAGNRGIGVEKGARMKVGDDLSVSVTQHGKLTQEKDLYGVFINKKSSLTVGNDAHITARGTTADRTDAQVLASQGKEGSSVSFGDRLSVDVAGNKYDYVEGTALYDKSVQRIGNDMRMKVRGTEAKQVYGLINSDSYSFLGHHADVSVTASGTINDLLGVFNRHDNNPDACFVAGNDMKVAVMPENHAHVNMIHGFYNLNGKSQIGNGASISVINEDSEVARIFGIRNISSIVTFGKEAEIRLSTLDKAGEASAVTTTGNGTTTFGDRASIIKKGKGTNISSAVRSNAGGHIVFDGAARIISDDYALYCQGANSMIDLSSAGSKSITGDVINQGEGTIKLSLDSADSFLIGASSVKTMGEKQDVTAADTTISLSNGAVWNMTAESWVTNLSNDNGGTVNMMKNRSYQNLHVGTYSGKNGRFKLKTDLASWTDGDKIHMQSAETGATGDIFVYDKSFALGKEITEERHLLIATDESGEMTFVGRELDTGGLWDVIPTIKRGGTFLDGNGHVVGNKKEWYLTKIRKQLNEDTIPVVYAGDSTYAFYRQSLDTLRQRLGNIRFREYTPEDTYDFWIKNKHGRFDAAGYDGRYNDLQGGMDIRINEKNTYGFLIERGIGNANYHTGSGKNHSVSGALYGVWTDKDGRYADIVAKWGRSDVKFYTCGQYPDRGQYRENEKSISIEYGRTVQLDENWFIEPQIQFVAGHLSGNSYMTEKRTKVSISDYNSGIGRLGFVLGKKNGEGNKPYDYYLKVSVLHEFGGDRGYSFRAVNGETYKNVYDYEDTWYEIGFGGTCQINANTYIYGDVAKGFCGDISKKWQYNIGINWKY